MKVCRGKLPQEDRRLHCRHTQAPTLLDFFSILVTLLQDCKLYMLVTIEIADWKSLQANALGNLCMGFGVEAPKELLPQICSSERNSVSAVTYIGNKATSATYIVPVFPRILAIVDSLHQKRS